jgi:hypothetical protein
MGEKNVGDSISVSSGPVGEREGRMMEPETGELSLEP